MRLRPLLVLAALLASVGARHVTAHEVPEPRGITVSAVGEAAGVPDILRVRIGVTRQDKHAEAALAANSRAVAALMASLKAAGVAARDLQTGQFNLGPLYDHPQGGQPRITGYQVNNTVVATLRDLEKAGTLLDTLVADGANTVHGFQFEVDDTTRLEAAARTAALASARTKAEHYAREAGVRLGKVIEIAEASQPGAAPVRLMRQAAMAEAASVPIEAGEATVSVQVTVRYEIAP